MLLDLKVLNGNLELKYNQYTYFYTVVVDNDINKLDLEYKLEDNTKINIIDNNLDNIENLVYIKVSNNQEEVTYTLDVYKESEEVNSIIDYKESLEINNQEEYNLLNVQLLAISIFFIIIVLFSIIFKKHS